jgi:hypothetical protein
MRGGGRRRRVGARADWVPYEPTGAGVSTCASVNMRICECVCSYVILPCMCARACVGACVSMCVQI